MASRSPSPTLRHFVPKPARRRAADGSGIDDSSTKEPRNLTRREQSVWRAVLMQALTDAMSNSKKPCALRTKREALIWLTSNSRDFRTVCDYAGYDPVYLFEKIQHLLSIQREQALPRASLDRFSLRVTHIRMRMQSPGWGKSVSPLSVDEDA